MSQMTQAVKFTWRRMLTVAAIGFAVTVMLAAVLPRQAAAAADGCVKSSRHPQSCVKVIGAGLWVDAVAGGVDLTPRQSVHGYFRVWGSGFDETTGSGTWWNQSYWHHKTYWGPAMRIGRSLPNHSKVCAQLIDSHGAHAPACETIHS
jgi:hypothetical protein